MSTQTMVERTQLTQPPAAQPYRHRIGEVEFIALSDRRLNYPARLTSVRDYPQSVFCTS